MSQRDTTFDIVALSGTSGGAICAALTWYGLLTGSEVKAIDLLDAFWKDNDEVSAEALLASAAIPALFRAVKIGDKVYWDGLFSQNPPVRELTETSPDEIWVIQINPPQTTKEPIFIEEIRDRRNKLAGNISLEQEIYFIRKINEFVNSKSFSNDKYKHIEIRRIRMLRDLNYSTKLERRLEFIQDMIAYGERPAEDFLKGLGFTNK